ncbi:MAG: alpha/beta hydrolase [Candidatus Neomarinimicrobiota bacterium]
MTDTITERFSPREIELGEGPIGCFLIHGFTGSTYELQGLAEFLSRQGFRVTAKLLAGHGTTIQDCNLVRAEDWVHEIEFHFTEFFLQCETTFVLGLSMGAGLALYLSTLFPVAGIVAMSSALILNFRWLRWYLPLIAPFCSSISKDRAEARKNTAQHPHYGYHYYPPNGLRAMLKLNRYIQAGLSKVTLPTLVMHSRADTTAPFENANLVFNRIRSEDKTLITYGHSGHVLPDSSEKEKVWSDILNFLTLHIPKQTRAIPLHQSR